MPTEACPLPEVAEALEPFIKTREEVTRIRRGLQAYLQNNLRKDDVPLSSTNLTDCPTSELGPPPTALSGVRKAYWRALEAHVVARERYDALQQDLDQLKHNTSASAGRSDSRTLHSSTDDYISLLRQREKYRKLKVIDRALSSITDAGTCESTSSLDDLVKKKLGEFPSPPSAQPSFNRNPEVGAKVVELKKAVVSTKRKVDLQRNRSPQHAVNGILGVSPQSDIAGLQKALQELTGWMEHQLTVIANAEAETQPIDASPTRNAHSPKTEGNIEDVEALYERYLEARQRLVRNANSTAHVAPNASPGDVEEASGAARAVKSITPVESPAATIVPFIPTLIAAKQEEQNLIRQNAFFRRHISTAQSENKRLIWRLADESHLAQPGASGGQDWAEAAREAGAETNDFVKRRLADGETSVSSAKVTLGLIQGLPHTFDSLI